MLPNRSWPAKVEREGQGEKRRRRRREREAERERESVCVSPKMNICYALNLMSNNYVALESIS